MKTRYTFHTVLLIALLLGGLFHFSACTSDSKRAETQISVSTPPRPAGQTDVVGLTCEPIETVRIGFIGLGARGTEAIRRFTYQKGIQVKALCDLNQFRVDSCQNMLSRANMPEAMQALCFMAGANSIFYGEKLLTTGNPEVDKDRQLMAKLDLLPLGG